MIKIPKPVHPLTQTFSEFVFRTLQVKHEVIKAQQEIRKECNDVAAKDIYNPNITKTMKVEEFKQIQKSSISQTSFYLRETWINRLKEIITIHFSPTHDMNATGGFSRTGSKLEGDGERDKKSWFNLSETNREVYEHSKLKKFLLQQKFVMQDTLYDMTRSSVDRYVDSILSFLPITCKVIDSNTVEQAYYTNDQIKTMGAPKPKFPLFQIDLQLSEENRPEYSHDPEEVVDCILKAFDSGLQALQDIIQLEQKLMPHLFKSNQKSYLKVPIKPSEMPIDPDPSDKKVLPDENKWVYEAYARLRSRVYETVEPLKVYLKTYDKYEKEYKLDPAAHIKKMDDQENPPEAEALRRDVLNHQKEAQRLMTEIPESIVVSMFKINCREIRN